MVFLEYQWRDTFFHRLNPVVKAVLFISISILNTLWLDTRLTSILLLIAIVFAYIGKYPKQWLTIIYIMMITFVITSLLILPYLGTTAVYKVYPEELMHRIIFVITPEGTPLIGYVYLTVGSIVWLLARLVSIPTLLLVWGMFIYSTKVSDFFEQLLNLKVPFLIIFTVRAAYRFIPIMIRKINTIMSAQKLRGFEAKTKNPITLVKKYAPITYPLASYLVTIVDQVSISTKTRAFGSGNVTILKDFKFTISDYLICSCSISAVVIALYLLLVYNVGMI